MSELTERSKCVFQAKLAEQAERYDGTTTITFRFMCACALFTRARVYIFVLNWNHQIGSFCSIIFSFKRASFGCVYTCKETNTVLSQYSQYYSHNAEMIVALKKLCGIADIELTVRKNCKNCRHF